MGLDYIPKLIIITLFCPFVSDNRGRDSTCRKSINRPGIKGSSH